jgi:hypothetical protein
MPRTALAVQEITPFTGLASIVFTAADSANGMMFPNDGRTLLFVRNNDVAAKTVTIVSVPDDALRTGDIPLVVPAAAAGLQAVAMSNPLRPGLFNQRTTDVGNVYVNFSAATNLTVAAVRINS